jgi:hypothetical protein
MTFFETKNSTLDAVDMLTLRAAKEFNRGGYIYAGILRDLMPADAIPAHPEVVRNFIEQRNYTPVFLAADIYEAGKAIPSYDRIVSAVGPVLIEGSQDLQAFTMGMGAVHKLVTESLREQMTEVDFDDFFDFLDKNP